MFIHSCTYTVTDDIKRLLSNTPLHTLINLWRLYVQQTTTAKIAEASELGYDPTNTTARIST